MKNFQILAFLFFLILASGLSSSSFAKSANNSFEMLRSDKATLKSGIDVDTSHNADSLGLQGVSRELGIKA